MEGRKIMPKILVVDDSPVVKKIVTTTSIRNLELNKGNESLKLLF